MKAWFSFFGVLTLLPFLKALERILDTTGKYAEGGIIAAAPRLATLGERRDDDFFLPLDNGKPVSIFHPTWERR